MNELKHLSLKSWELKNEHAEKFMQRHGITYEHAEPNMAAECWHFFNCQNVPDVLPNGLRVFVPNPKYWGDVLEKLTSNGTKGNT